MGRKRTTPDPFPGPIVRSGCGPKVTLTAAQEQWLRQWYPEIENKTLRAAMGISLRTLTRLAAELGIEKSEEGRKAIFRRRVARMVATCERNGYYDSLRGRRQPEYLKEGLKRWHKDILDGKAPPSITIFRRNHPRRYAAWRREKSERRRKTVRQEKFRLLSGGRRETGLRLRLAPYTRSQISHRYSALQRGYWFYDDCSEEGGERWNIYWDDDTRRSARFERNCEKDGFHILDGREAGGTETETMEGER